MTNPWVAPFFRMRLQINLQGRPRQISLPQPLAVTSTYVAYQQDRFLYALDPVSGDTLWIRDDFPGGSDLFGDERRLVVTPPGSAEATVISAIDGRTLGQRTVPSIDTRLATHGYAALVWNAGDTGAELKLIDPWEQQTVWQQEFPATAKPCVVDSSEVAVLDAEGRFVVLSVKTGETLVETSVDALPDLEHAFALRSEDRYLLIANRPPPKQTQPTTFNRVPAGHMPVEGRVFGIDARSGEKLWAADASNQWLKINHPAGLPVLTFFKRFQKAIRLSNNSWRSEQPVALVRCLDTRTGKLLHTSSNKNSYDQTCNIIAHPDQHRVKVETRLETVTFEFSGK
jgi:outer membrane protein assembly factor BamB